MPAMRRVPLLEYPARRIALIKPSSLGDIIHCLPVATALRRRFPDAYLCWVVNHTYAPLLQDHPDLDATLPFDRSAARRGVLQAAFTYHQWIRRLRRQAFDLVIDLQGLLRSALLTVATGAPRRVGLSSAREGARWFYTDVVPVADFQALHAVDRYWLAAEALGAGAGPKRFRLTIPDADQGWATDFLRECPRPWLLLGPGSRWVTKRWPPEHFASLARQAQDRFGGTVIFVGGREEMALAQAVAAHLTGPVRDLTGRTSLPRLAAVLARADVMLANDTGPLHLAAALGRPVVAPYTCTKVLLNGPYGAESGAVETRIGCQGSYLKRCPRLDCMTELTPGRLWPVLEGILSSWPNRDRHSA
jgi:lipopolysaccharide heptosyltransferase I